MAAIAVVARGGGGVVVVVGLGEAWWGGEVGGGQGAGPCVGGACFAHWFGFGGCCNWYCSFLYMFGSMNWFLQNDSLRLMGVDKAQYSNGLDREKVREIGTFE